YSPDATYGSVCFERVAGSSNAPYEVSADLLRTPTRQFYQHDSGLPGDKSGLQAATLRQLKFTMENRSRLTHASIGAGLLLLLLAWQATCIADQSTPAQSEESLTQRANDPTATLTQVQIKNEYTPSQYGTNAQPNTLILRGILAVQPHGPLNLEQIIRPTFQIVTKPLGKGAATRTGFGDTQLFDLFIMPWPNSRETGFRWGVGPYFVFPTASWHGAGQGAWQLGPAWAFAYHRLPHLVISALFQQATSFAYTSSKRSPVSSLTFQPLLTY